MKRKKEEKEKLTRKPWLKKGLATAVMVGSYVGGTYATNLGCGGSDSDNNEVSAVTEVLKDTKDVVTNEEIKIDSVTQTDIAQTDQSVSADSVSGQNDAVVGDTSESSDTSDTQQPDVIKPDTQDDGFHPYWQAAAPGAGGEEGSGGDVIIKYGFVKRTQIG